MAANIYKINCNAAPMLLFAKFFERVLQIRETAVDLGDFPSELVRIESNDGAARTGELFMTIYPSDAFLVFAATVAGDINFNVVEQSGHSASK